MLLPQECNWLLNLTGLKVQVYRNLHRNCYSVRYKGKVIAHVKEITLLQANFRVSQAGRARVLKERRKNVHAYVEGVVTDNFHELIHHVTYNPYKAPYFFERNMKTRVNYAGVANLKDGMVLI